MQDKCPENCPLVPRVEALERENERHTETHKEIFKRLNAVEKENGEQGVVLNGIDKKLDKLIEWQDEQQDRLAKVDSIPELTERVTALEARPGKRWDSFGDKILWFVIEAVLIVVAVKIGLR